MNLLLVGEAAAAAGGGEVAKEGSGGLAAAAQILLTHGGPFPYLNIISSIVGIAIIIERTIMLFRYSISGEPFMNQLVRLVREGQIDRAVKLCSAAPNSVLARVLKAGLTRANRGEAEISAAMEEAMLEVSPLVSKRIPALFPLANIATLIGLIGTIRGLITTFAALRNASPEMKNAVMAQGISEAMYNTAFGLLIAVTCITAQLALGLKSKGMQEEMEFNAARLDNLLARRAAGDLDEKAA